MEFHLLRGLLDDSALNSRIDALLELKSQSGERAEVEAIPELNEFIDREIQACNEAVKSIPTRTVAPDALDEFFRSLVVQQQISQT